MIRRKEVTSGGSVADTISVLRDQEMTLSQSAMLLGQRANGSGNTGDLGVTLSQVLTMLTKHGKISEDNVKEVGQFVLNNPMVKKKGEGED